MTEPKGRGGAWTEERETSDEGRSRLEAPRRRAEDTAAGLVERSAAAYAAAVPDHPQDEGFFGPASVTWRVAGDLSAPVAGLRSLLMQALHPLAMAGVDQHSDWRSDPVGRLAATSGYEATVTFGDQASATRVAERVRAIHSHVRGVDAVTSQPYAARPESTRATWTQSSSAGSPAAYGWPVTVSTPCTRMWIARTRSATRVALARSPKVTMAS